MHKYCGSYIMFNLDKNFLSRELYIRCHTKFRNRGKKGRGCLFVWGFMPYRQYFGYFMVIVDKYIFP